ncbi:hypothetical protein KM043_009393 [Ampulex compressa]|nr:hypothetical protein KM043_009393 [Ampulex compressa]
MIPRHSGKKVNRFRLLPTMAINSGYTLIFEAGAAGRGGADKSRLQRDIPAKKQKLHHGPIEIANPSECTLATRPDKPDPERSRAQLHRNADNVINPPRPMSANMFVFLNASAATLSVLLFGPVSVPS